MLEQLFRECGGEKRLSSKVETLISMKWRRTHATVTVCHCCMLLPIFLKLRISICDEVMKHLLLKETSRNLQYFYLIIWSDYQREIFFRLFTKMIDAGYLRGRVSSLPRIFWSLSFPSTEATSCTAISNPATFSGQVRTASSNWSTSVWLSVCGRKMSIRFRVKVSERQRDKQQQ